MMRKSVNLDSVTLRKLVKAIMRNRALRGCLILTISSMAIVHGAAKSKHPPTRPSELSQPTDQKGETNAPAPTEDKRGTDEIPLTIKILPGQKTESEAAKEEYESHEKPQLERGLTTYTGWLAIFTAILFIAAFIQVGLFYWQLRYMRAGIVDAKIAADAAREAADAAKMSANAFCNIERAYVFLDHEEMPKRNPRLGVVPFSTFKVVFRNFGKTPAIINGLNVKCLHWPNKYPPKLSADNEPVPNGITIGSNNCWDFPAFIQATVAEIDEVPELSH